MTNRINVIGSNQTEIKQSNGTIIFYSYNTPVVALFDGKWYKTNKKWSNTTSKHINKYLDGINALETDQSFFDNL